jgi:glycerophosphoryl diester phosphodiesterase
LAIKQNADALECDIHLDAENEVIVIHDKTTTRTTGLDKRVDRLIVTELKQLDAGRWKGDEYKNVRIPTLKEVFAILPKDKKIFIEIKSGIRAIRPINLLLEKSIISHSQINMMAFDLDTLIRLRKMFTDIEILLLYELPDFKKGDDIRKKLKDIIYIANRHIFDGVNLQNIQELDADFIQACKGQNLKCYCWTVNDAERAKYLMKSGINGIATDRPGWIRAQLSLALLS